MYAQLEALMQVDVGQRGLGPLFAATRGNLAAAAKSLLDSLPPSGSLPPGGGGLGWGGEPAKDKNEQPRTENREPKTAARVVIVTGFLIPGVRRPETDGPLGALVLADAIRRCGGQAVLATDAWLAPQLCWFESQVMCVVAGDSDEYNPQPWLEQGGPTYLIAIERPGPSHFDGRLRSMRRLDITADHADVEEWFLHPPPGCVTIGIGDGGNEIGMGSLPAELVASAIPNGALIGCRVPVNHLLVAGISNWAAYALAGALVAARVPEQLADLFDEARHAERLRRLVHEDGLVDGWTGTPALAIDGQPWDAYIQVFRAIRQLLSGRE